MNDKQLVLRFPRDKDGNIVVSDEEIEELRRRIEACNERIKGYKRARRISPEIWNMRMTI